MCTFLNIIIGKSTSIFQLLASKDEPLLIGWNSLLILDLGLYIFNGVRGLYLESDGFTRKGFHKDLHDGLSKLQSNIAVRIANHCRLWH